MSATAAAVKSSSSRRRRARDDTESESETGSATDDSRTGDSRTGSDDSASDSRSGSGSDSGTASDSDSGTGSDSGSGSQTGSESDSRDRRRRAKPASAALPPAPAPAPKSKSKSKSKSRSAAAADAALRTASAAARAAAASAKAFDAETKAKAIEAAAKAAAATELERERRLHAQQLAAVKQKHAATAAAAAKLLSKQHEQLTRHRQQHAIQSAIAAAERKRAPFAATTPAAGLNSGAAPAPGSAGSGAAAAELSAALGLQKQVLSELARIKSEWEQTNQTAAAQTARELALVREELSRIKTDLLAAAAAPAPAPAPAPAASAKATASVPATPRTVAAAEAKESAAAAALERELKLRADAERVRAETEQIRAQTLAAIATLKREFEAQNAATVAAAAGAGTELVSKPQSVTAPPPPAVSGDSLPAPILPPASTAAAAAGVQQRRYSTDIEQLKANSAVQTAALQELLRARSPAAATTTAATAFDSTAPAAASPLRPRSRQSNGAGAGAGASGSGGVKAETVRVRERERAAAEAAVASFSASLPASVQQLIEIEKEKAALLRHARRGVNASRDEEEDDAASANGDADAPTPTKAAAVRSSPQRRSGDRNGTNAGASPARRSTNRASPKKSQSRAPEPEAVDESGIGAGSEEYVDPRLSPPATAAAAPKAAKSPLRATTKSNGTTPLRASANRLVVSNVTGGGGGAVAIPPADGASYPQSIFDTSHPSNPFTSEMLMHHAVNLLLLQPPAATDASNGAAPAAAVSSPSGGDAQLEAAVLAASGILNRSAGSSAPVAALSRLAATELVGAAPPPAAGSTGNVLKASARQPASARPTAVPSPRPSSRPASQPTASAPPVRAAAAAAAAAPARGGSTATTDDDGDDASDAHADSVSESDSAATPRATISATASTSSLASPAAAPAVPSPRAAQPKQPIRPLLLPPAPPPAATSTTSPLASARTERKKLKMKERAVSAAAAAAATAATVAPAPAPAPAPVAVPVPPMKSARSAANAASTLDRKHTPISVPNVQPQATSVSPRPPAAAPAAASAAATPASAKDSDSLSQSYADAVLSLPVPNAASLDAPLVPSVRPAAAAGAGDESDVDTDTGAGASAGGDDDSGEGESTDQPSALPAAASTGTAKPRVLSDTALAAVLGAGANPNDLNLSASLTVSKSGAVAVQPAAVAAPPAAGPSFASYIPDNDEIDRLAAIAMEEAAAAAAVTPPATAPTAAGGGNSLSVSSTSITESIVDPSVLPSAPAGGSTPTAAPAPAPAPAPAADIDVPAPEAAVPLANRAIDKPSSQRRRSTGPRVPLPVVVTSSATFDGAPTTDANTPDLGATVTPATASAAPEPERVAADLKRAGVFLDATQPLTPPKLTTNPSRPVSQPAVPTTGGGGAIDKSVDLNRPSGDASISSEFGATGAMAGTDHHSPLLASATDSVTVVSPKKELDGPTDRKRAELDAAAAEAAFDSANETADAFELIGKNEAAGYEDAAPTDMGVNAVFYRRLKVLIRIGCCNGRTCALTPVVIKVIGIFVLSIIIAIAQILVLNPLLGTFTQAIVDKDGEGILHAVTIASGASIVIAIGYVCIQYLGQRVCLDWRASLTTHFQEILFNNSLLYNIVSIQRRIDNTDQRVASAIGDFALGMGGVFVGNYDVGGGGLILPIFLFLSAVFSLFQYGYIPAIMMVGWFIIALIITLVVSQRISKLVFQQDKYEGDLRFTHNLVRTFNESIAFYGGEQQELKTAKKRFRSVYENYRHLLRWEFWMAFFQGFSSNVIAQSMGYAAVILLNGLHIRDFGDISSVTDVVLAVLSGVAALLSLPQVIATLGPVAGNGHRLGELLEVCDETVRRLAAAANGSAGPNVPRGVYVDGSTVKLVGVTIATPAVIPLHPAAPTGGMIVDEPAPTVMYRNISFEVARGQSVLIMGPSGSGKTSLLRVIGNLWPLQDGTVTRPGVIGRGGIFFVPQRPYLTKGTLRQQLIYPHSTSQSTDAELIALLTSLELGFIFKSWGLDSVVDWSDVLSGGESQRLGFARLLYHSPAVAVMDESTSALDVPLEAKCFRLCRERGISMLSVAHRPTAIPFHDYIVRLKRGTNPAAAARAAAESKSGNGNNQPLAISAGSFVVEPVTAETRQHIEAELALFGVSQQSVNSPIASASAGVDSKSAPVVHSGATVADVEPDDTDGVHTPLNRNGAADKKTTSPIDIKSGGVTAAVAGVNNSGDSFEDWYAKERADKKPAAPTTDTRVNMLFFRRLRVLIRIGFPHAWCVPARYFYLSLVAILTALLINAVLLGLTSQLFVAESEHRTDDAVQILFISLFLATLSQLMLTLVQWLGSVICLQWRAALMTRAESLYYARHMSYTINSLDKRLDNIDQRMVQDCKDMTELSAAWMFGNIINPSAIAVLGQCVIMTYLSVKLAWFPTVTSYAFWVFGLIITPCLLGRVTEATFAIKIQEGTFRWLHARSRIFCESIRFYNGESKERSDVTEQFKAVYDSIRHWINKRIPLAFFVFLYNQWGNLLGYCMIGVGVLFFEDVPGGRGDRTYQTKQLLGALTILFSSLNYSPTIIANVSFIAGAAHRVAEMFEVLEDVSASNRHAKAKGIVSDGAMIRADNISVETPAPNIRTLFRQLTFEVLPKPTSSLIIVGPSGCGKSSLLRVIAGLWSLSSGQMTRPSRIGRGGLFFVPQRPYITEGSLRAQVLFPASDLKSDSLMADDPLIIDILRSVGLEYLVDEWGLEAVESWSDILSLGEQQRLGFARLLYHSPAYAIMDESTSALDPDLELQCMSLVLRAQPPITLITVAHRPSIIRYHKFILRLSLNPLTRPTVEPIPTGVQINLATDAAHSVPGIGSPPVVHRSELDADGSHFLKPVTGHANAATPASVSVTPASAGLTATVTSVADVSAVAPGANPNSAHVMSAADAAAAVTAALDRDADLSNDN